jgi:hypothetical protein
LFAHKIILQAEKSFALDFLSDAQARALTREKLRRILGPLEQGNTIERQSVVKSTVAVARRISMLS